MTEVTDPHNLTRFLEGQKRFYDIALNKLKIGEKKRTLDVVHLPTVPRFRMESNLQTLFNQQPGGSQRIPSPPTARTPLN